jgi:hypothetical protein
MADGRHVPVRSPEFMWRVPGGRTLFVSEGEESFHMFDALLVTDVEVETRGHP